jgi:hypothetical protein
MSNRIVIGSALLAVAAFVYFMPAFASAEDASPAPAEVKSIAEDSNFFAYPMLYGTRRFTPRHKTRLFPAISAASVSTVIMLARRHLPIWTSSQQGSTTDSATREDAVSTDGNPG